MTSDELKDAVSTVLGQSGSAQLYFVLKVNDKFSLRLADIEDENTEPEIRELFEGFLQTSIVSNEDMIVRKLSSADESSNAVYEYDYDEYPDELNLFIQFNIKREVGIDRFNFTSDNLSNLFGYIIYIGSMENGIVLFKKHYPISLIKRDSFLLGAIKCRERFEKLPGEDIIRLGGDVQLLRVGETIFVLNIKMLEHNMGFSHLIRREANQTIKNIESLDIIDDIEVLRDMLEVASFARKLAKVRKASPIFKLGLSRETIIEFTKSTPALAGKFKYNEDETRIRLDTRKSKVEFLKLLNDAYLHSELTQQWYETSAKDNITKNIE